MPATLLLHWKRMKSDPRAAWFAFLLVGVLLAVLPALVDASFGRSWVRVLNFTLLYVMLALGLNIVVGYAGLLDLGYVAFFAVGAYAYALLASPHFGIHLPFWVILPLGALLAAMFGAMLGAPTLRLRGDYLAIVTLGFGEIVRVLLQASRHQLDSAAEIQRTSWLHLSTMLGGSLGFISLPFYTTLFWVYAFTALTLLVTYRLKYSSYGRAFLSIREDEVAAEAMGIHTTRFKVRAFVLAAFFAGLAGALYAHSIGSINAGELGFQKSFDLVIMVVLGGMGSISGSALAAALLTILPEALRKVTDQANQYLPAAYALPDLRMVIYSLALILMMILRPQGLFGLHEIWDWRPLRRRQRSTRRKPVP
jgi:branched-chain amino acid transport system permease protein